MNREEKRQVIESLAAKLNEYPHFYITDIAELNAEQTAALRRQCFEKEVNLMVVKNTLSRKHWRQPTRPTSSSSECSAARLRLCSPP